MTDVTLPIILAATSLASALFGFRAGRKRGTNHTRELNKIGRLLRVGRLRGESNDDYAARLSEHMTEKTNG